MPHPSPLLLPLRNETPMPLYDFHCQRCDTVLERLTRPGDQPQCPACGCVMERLISRPQAPGKSAAFIQRSGAQAAKEGHFSNYSASERPKIG